MRIIIVNQQHGSTRSVKLSRWARGFLSFCLLGVPVALGYFGYGIAVDNDKQVFTDELAAQWSDEIQAQRSAVEQLHKYSQLQLNSLTSRIGLLQNRLMRLDALGERLTNLAKLDNGEFDFSQQPALGGPETNDLGAVYQPPEFVDALDQLLDVIADREQQLEILQTLLGEREIKHDVYISGRPINKGWLSSRFGRRPDPFTGKVAWHDGVDFAGKEGDSVVSVAGGLVTFSGEKAGYGQMVKLNHTGGYTTLYAHCKNLLVKPGDVIKKGQVIALMGSTGRSTGPHVHFEVYKHGRVVDPATYIYRTSR